MISEVKNFKSRSFEWDFLYIDVVKEMKLDTFFDYDASSSKCCKVVDVGSCFDYYPYGMLMPGRNEQVDGYRYGFNGMEMDNEVSGNGNSYTTEFRQYDPRLGRWKSVDPFVMPWESPYVGMNNNPIVFTDTRGDCPWCGFFSAVLDAAIQIVDIATDPNKTYKDFSIASVATSFVAGLAGAGIANNIKKLYSVAKLTRRTKAIITIATEVTVDSGISVVKQKVDGERVNVKRALIDATIGQTVGKFIGRTIGKYFQRKSSVIKNVKDQLNKTPKGPKGTKQRNKLKRKIKETGEALENDFRVQGAITTSTGVTSKLEEKLEDQVNAHVSTVIPDGYNVTTKPIMNGETAKWEGQFKNGKLYTGIVTIYDSEGLLKSIAIVKNGVTIKRNASLEDAKKYR